MAELHGYDLRFVAQRLPRDVADLLKQHSCRLFVGGGFIRACIAGEVPSDIDLFGDDAAWLEQVATALVSVRPGARMHKSKNAITVITPDRLPVQFITRWTFKNANECMLSFDFTVCQAIVFRYGAVWQSCVGERFYSDLAARRLYYTSPVRSEEAGGSMLRVLKYVKRGYSIQVDSLGRVIGRLVEGVKEERLGEHERGVVIAGLLREVDPLLVIDGFDVVDDHEPVEGETLL